MGLKGFRVILGILWLLKKFKGIGILRILSEFEFDI